MTLSDAGRAIQIVQLRQQPLTASHALLHAPALDGLAAAHMASGSLNRRAR
ncbi:hypothetical protein [Ralstonia soli]|uniref:Uncharacterized protein n=1 Tax=Ralstonia soli TaxID=2953896 RepID=A0ABT1AIY8_9RALS|nr:hypothetical protein [Ralstonia soli]MCO5398360.1 hypothetical protein [Ralstonia soli]